MAKHVIKRWLAATKHPLRAEKSAVVEEWSIGIYVGTSPFHFAPSKNIDNPVLTCEDVSDVQAVVVADPFLVKEKNIWYMFFEVFNSLSKKGEIGLATSEDEVQWQYQHIVLDEIFHLSYPYVFKWQDDYYMLPESFEAKAVRLYKAVDFPTTWSFVTTLINGRAYVDPSIFYYNATWWLFAGLGALGYQSDTLRLYYAYDLMGPWLEHPQSPIIEDNLRAARPAGRVLVLNDTIVRYAQDCYPFYGTQVRAFAITELTPTTYHEQEADQNPVIAGSGSGWNASGMHHCDPHPRADGRWIASVDGYVRIPARNAATAFTPWSRRRKTQ